LWSVNVGSAIAGTPLLDGETLYVGTFGNELLAINTQSHEITNRFSTTDWVWATPVLQDGVLYFGDLDGYIYALDIATWQQKWKVRDEEHKGAIRGKLAVVDGLILAGLDSKYLTAFTIDGVHKCSSQTAERILSDMIVIGNDVIFTTLDPKELVAGYNINTCIRSWGVAKPGDEDIKNLAQATQKPE
jgi:eukaryotic-like serine/threonine-protein kinase